MTKKRINSGRGDEEIVNKKKCEGEITYEGDAQTFNIKFKTNKTDL